MIKSDPFGFNISAANDKKRRAPVSAACRARSKPRRASATTPAARKPVSYRAPKSPEKLDEYLWFCRDRPRIQPEVNFFPGARATRNSRSFLDNSTVWERPTKPFGQRGEEAPRLGAALTAADPMETLGSNATPTPVG